MSGNTDFDNMTEDQKIAAYEKYQAEMQAIEDQKVGEAVEEIHAAFDNPEQAELISDLFKLIVDQKANLKTSMQASIQVAAVVEALYQKLVGVDKLISDEEFEEIAGEAYKTALTSMLGNKR